MIDAYCHVGLPRFGTAENALAVADLYDIQKFVLVLGPMVPDYATLFEAMRQHGDRIRGVGIPFGETREQQVDAVELQLRAGVMAMRLQGNELLPEILEMVGDAGRWIYAIGLRSGGQIAQTVLDWLETYEHGRVAAPHFLSPDATVIEGALADLVAHPRFFPIFSRHGGLGSQKSYPHEDMKPWVKKVIGLAGWERVMWGSECPVLYWRDETMPKCLTWLGELTGESHEKLAKFLGENAQREIFDPPLPRQEAVTIPDWVNEQFDHTRTVPVFDYGGLELPMDVYAKLHKKYVAQLQLDPELSFGHFVRDFLVETLR